MQLYYDEDSYFRGYFPLVRYDRRDPGRKLARNPELASYVIDGLSYHPRMSG